jgi:uncharacterized membrane protein YoaK (UPF0700 family)
MKHVIVILITLILTGFAVGVSYLSRFGGLYGILFIPLFILYMFWGYFLMDEYGDK